eukprot:7968238-Pyramimonas_sp.AAC.1
MLRVPVGGGSGGDDDERNTSWWTRGPPGRRAHSATPRAPAIHEPTQAHDIRAADDGRAKHHGEKSAPYNLLDSPDVHGVGIDNQVADVSRPTMGVAEACDNGHSVLFSPTG